MSAERDFLAHTLDALDRIEDACKPRVKFEKNPLDACHVCGAEDKYASFELTHQNGREIVLCDRCR